MVVAEEDEEGEDDDDAVFEEEGEAGAAVPLILNRKETSVRAGDYASARLRSWRAWKKEKNQRTRNKGRRRNGTTP